MPPLGYVSPAVLNVTVMQSTNATVYFNSSSKQPLTLLYDSSKLPSTLNVTNESNPGLLTLFIQGTPSSADLQNGSIGSWQLAWAAKDSDGATSSQLTLPVHYCLGCSEPNGSCNFDAFRDGSIYNTVDAVKEVACSCKAGYTGQDCKIFMDVCSNNPCAPGNCTALSYSERINSTLPFKCFNCGIGYQLNSISICIDIDECKNAAICGATGACINTPGSYSCSCPRGYGDNQKNCIAPAAVSLFKLSMSVKPAPLDISAALLESQLTSSLKTVFQSLPGYIYVSVDGNISNATGDGWRHVEFTVGLSQKTSGQTVLIRLATALRDNGGILPNTNISVQNVTTNSSLSYSCTASNICQSGGRCEDHIGIATCWCNFAWTSDDCSQFTTDGVIAAVVGAVALAVLIVIIAGGSVLYARRRAAWRHRNRYYTSESSSGSLEYPSGKRAQAYNKREALAWRRFTDDPVPEDQATAEADEVDSIFGARSNVTVHRMPRNDPDTLSFDFPTLERDINGVRADMTFMNQRRWPFTKRQTSGENN